MKEACPVPSRVVVRAPVRVLDAGGWTDTWFAGQGAVCHLAVGDGTQVTIEVGSVGGDDEALVDLWVRPFDERSAFPCTRPRAATRSSSRPYATGARPTVL